MAYAKLAKKITDEKLSIKRVVLFLLQSCIVFRIQRVGKDLLPVRPVSSLGRGFMFTLIGFTWGGRIYRRKQIYVSHL